MSWLLKLAANTLTVYHTTVAGTKILSEGFKTRQELSNKSSLGGGTNDTISVTTDWVVAKGIFDGILFMWTLANADDPVAACRKHFDSLPPEKKEKLESMHKGGHGGNLSLDLQGKKIGSSFSLFSKEKRPPMTREELEQHGFTPYVVDGEEKSVVDGKYWTWLEPMNEEDIFRFVYDYVKSYLASDDEVYDPLFFATSAQNFVGIPRDDIGILTLEINIDPSKASVDDMYEHRDATHRYVDSMAEIRIRDKSMIQSILAYETNPGDEPPVSSRQQFYHANPYMESAVDWLIKIMKKHYRLFSRYVSVDSVISMLQNRKDEYALYQLLGSLKKALKIDRVDSILEDVHYLNTRLIIPPVVQEGLNLLPADKREAILGGDSEVLDRWYDEDRVAFSNFWEKIYDKWHVDIDTEIRKWQDDYIRAKARYDRQVKDMWYTDIPPEEMGPMAEISTVIRKILNTQRDKRVVPSLVR